MNSVTQLLARGRALQSGHRNVASGPVYHTGSLVCGELEQEAQL